ncbi:interleukin-17 receptor E-like protein [Stigmatopora nigra]
MTLTSHIIQITALARKKKEELSAKMILWISLLIMSLHGTAAQHLKMERNCGIKCSQGLQCKTKSVSLVDSVLPTCQVPVAELNASSVFRNLSLSTAVRCDARRCGLHLQIDTSFLLSGSIRGLSVCSQSSGMSPKCQMVTVSRASRRKMAELEVEVENDCLVVNPRQEVKVTVMTIPRYCGISRSVTYVAPDCSWKDLRRRIPECITGEISHEVSLEKKEVRVSVRETPEGQDYHVRLCHKDLICTSTGADALIKKEALGESVVLSFARPLPCLCIEGWSAVIDAPRVQVCPFQDRVEEMWHGIRFDPLEETLSWEAACPLSVQVALCQKEEDGACSDLDGTWRNISRGQITFTKVDPHPQLCMKFTTTSNKSWIRCPFVRRFQVWDVTLTQQVATLTSQINGMFYISVCTPALNFEECHIAGMHTTIPVEERSSVSFSLGDANSCLYVRRIDVKYAATVQYCFPI